jgi:hypothetical protein
MDVNECNTLIQAARSATGKTMPEIVASLDEAAAAFRKATREKFSSSGEW